MKRTELKRTGFKSKPVEWKSGRKPLKWKADKPKETKGLFEHLKKESKVEEWRRIEKEITPFFVSNGIYDYCELRLSNCKGNFQLCFAHSKKRGDWAKDEPQRGIDARQVVRACSECHNEIEYPEVDRTAGENGKEIMYNIVVQTIEKRNKRLTKWS